MRFLAMFLTKQLTFLLFSQAVGIAAQCTNDHIIDQEEVQVQGNFDLTTKEDPDANMDQPVPDVQCTVHYPKVSMISWVPEEQIVYTENVTVGIISTLVLLHNASVVATKTHTDYNMAIASDGELPPRLETDVEGTAIAAVALRTAGSTTILKLRYPNAYIDYGTEYSWEGILETTNHHSSSYWATATARPSTVTISEHTTIPRSWYPEPTQDRTTTLDPEGRRLQPLWVSLDVVGDIASIMDRNFYNNGAMAFDRCNRTTPTGIPATSTFHTTRFTFSHTTILIPVNASSDIRQNETKTGPPYNNRTEANATMYEGHWFEGDPMTTIEIGSLSFNQVRNGSTFTGDRTGMYQRTAKGWERTTGGPDEDMPFPGQFPSDWELPIVPSEPQTTRSYREPDPSEAQVIANYFSSRLGSKTQVNLEQTNGVLNHAPTPAKTRLASPPQQDPALDELATDRGHIDADAVSNYLSEHSHTPPKPISDERLHIAPLGGYKSPHTVVDIHAIHETLVPTTAAVYVVLGSSLASAGPEVTLKAKPAVLSIPDLLPTYVSTTINGVPTSMLAYIVRGQSTATVGQTITLDERPTVLGFPPAVFAQVTTILHGKATDVPVFVIDGSSMASIGQKVTLDETPTVLATPDLMPTLVLEIVDGTARSSIAFMVSGSSIATIGQIVTMDGKVTVLSEPTWPIVVEGGAAGDRGVSWSATFVGLVGILIFLL